MVAILKNSRGIAFVVVIFLSSILLTMIGAGLLFSQLGLKTASNFKVGSNAIQVADAGIQHALAAIPSGTDFTYGSGATVLFTTPFPTAASGYSYEVTATNNTPSSPSTSTAILTATAVGPNGSKKVIVAYIGRSSTFQPPGATYLPGAADKIETQITGNATISGYDHDVNGNQITGAASIPAIATTDPNTTAEIPPTINNPGLITGSGGTPSVGTSSIQIDVNALAAKLLTLPHDVVAAGSYSNLIMGTPEAPKITRVTGAVHFSGSKTQSSGVGVLIIEGDLQISGNFNFKGLVIALGDVEVQISGNGQIIGALMVPESTVFDNPPELKISGNGTIKYSSAAINNYVATNWGSALPKPAKILAWQEKFSI